MTIRDSNNHNNDRNAYPAIPSAPTEEELIRGSSSVEPEVIVEAEPVYPGAYDGGDVPFVQATSVVSEQYPYASSSYPHSSTATNPSTSGPIALATGPARPSPSFAVATGPARPPHSSMTPGTNAHQPVHPTAQYNSRYRDSNGALTCCAISVIVAVSICVCCFLPFFIIIIAWSSIGWTDLDDTSNWNQHYVEGG
jgi:hypothetical protein